MDCKIIKTVIRNGFILEDVYYLCMEPTSEISCSGGPLNRTLFYSDTSLDLDEFKPYFFLGELPRASSKYDALYLLFSQSDVRSIRSGKSGFREDTLSESINEDCFQCKTNSSSYEINAFSYMEIEDERLRKVRLCGDCLESILSSISLHVDEESQIIQYEL